MTQTDPMLQDVMARAMSKALDAENQENEEEARRV